LGAVGMVAPATAVATPTAPGTTATTTTDTTTDNDTISVLKTAAGLKYIDLVQERVYHHCMGTWWPLLTRPISNCPIVVTVRMYRRIHHRHHRYHNTTTTRIPISSNTGMLGWYLDWMKVNIPLKWVTDFDTTQIKFH
jgi:hypothetical protein